MSETTDLHRRCSAGPREGNSTMDPAIETQALSSRKNKVSYMSLPHKSQLAVLMLARLAEPLAASSIQSYLFFQLQHFDPSASPATISARAGVMVGAKTAAHVCTGLLWGRLADSDYGGRKMVLVIGLMASAISMLGYGFSESFAAAIAWQIVDGAMNGTVSMVRCVTAELNPQKRYRARALTLLPLCTNVGHFLGPLIGGFLAASESQQLSTGFVSRYPYAAPNIVIAAVHILAALGAVFVLEETLENARRSGSGGWQGIWSRLRRTSSSTEQSDRDASSTANLRDESTPLLSDTRDAGASPPTLAPNNPPTPTTRDRLPFRQMWTFNVVSTLFTYFIISGHMGTFPSLWAIFLSAPVEMNKKQHPPFRLYGGLGMDPRGVGTAMALQGAIGVATQVMLYPTLNDRFGTIRLWRAALFVFPIAYFLAPFCALVSFYTLDRSKISEDGSGRVAVWASVLFVLFLSVVGRTGVAPATSLLINDCAPHPSVRATIHTTGTIVSSLSRSIFPPAAFAIFGFGLRIGLVGLGFWFIAGLAALACVASLWVTEGTNCNEAETSSMTAQTANQEDSSRT